MNIQGSTIEFDIESLSGDQIDNLIEILSRVRDKGAPGDNRLADEALAGLSKQKRGRFVNLMNEHLSGRRTKATVDMSVPLDVTIGGQQLFMVEDDEEDVELVTEPTALAWELAVEEDELLIGGRAQLYATVPRIMDEVQKYEEDMTKLDGMFESLSEESGVPIRALTAALERHIDSCSTTIKMPGLAKKKIRGRGRRGKKAFKVRHSTSAYSKSDRAVMRKLLAGLP